MLIPFHQSNHKEAFMQYVNQWQMKHGRARDQHYYAKIYLKILTNYNETMSSFLAESKPHLLEQGLPWCQYYWWLENEKILGTVRYRLNDKEIYGQVGCEVAPQIRNKGIAKKMLHAFIQQMKGQTKELYFTVPEYNTASTKVLESQGAKFTQKLYFQEFDEYLNQYRVELD